MSRRGEHALIGVLGGLLYVGMELLFRGHSHWTMFLLGAVCFVAIGVINEFWPGMPLPAQMAVGALIVTAAELLTGLIVNIWLCWHIWDYSGMPGNVMGQICPAFSALWALLSGAAVYAEDAAHAALALFAALIAEQAKTAAEVEGIKHNLYDPITGNPHTYTFDSLTGIKVVSGVWNQPQARLEC